MTRSNADVEARVAFKSLDPELVGILRQVAKPDRQPNHF